MRRIGQAAARAGPIFCTRINPMRTIATNVFASLAAVSISSTLFLSII